MSTIERIVSDVSSPHGVSPGTVRRASVTSAEVWAIPSAWLGKLVRFHLVAGTRGFVRFGVDADVSVDATTESALDGTSKAITENATPREPHLVLEPGIPRDERIDPKWTHLAHIEAATGGFLIATVKTGRGTVKAGE